MTIVGQARSGRKETTATHPPVRLLGGLRTLHRLHGGDNPATAAIQLLKAMFRLGAAVPNRERGLTIEHFRSC